VKSILCIVLFCIAILVVSAPAQAIVEVMFIEPGNCTGGSVRGGLFGSGGLGTVNIIRKRLRRLGEQPLSLRDGLRI